MNYMVDLTNSRDESDQASQELELTILMPCLNEAETIEVCVRKACDFLERKGIEGEVLVADNGSTDGSQDLAQSLGARVIAIKDRGYGAALLGGINQAKGRYIIMGDADDSYDFSSLEPFVAALRDGADLVMGNRFAGGIQQGAMPAIHRYLGNPVLSFLGRLFFKIPVGDFHCGLRGFNTESIRGLGLKTSGMEFASEMVVRCSLANYRIEEVPTKLHPDGRSRPPHLRTWRDGWRHLKFLLMYSPRWLFFVPGLAMVLVGALTTGLLLGGPLRLGNIIFDLNTFFVFCFLAVVGAQFLSLGVVVQQYAVMSGFRPPTRRTTWLQQNMTTDRMALLAFGLIVLGLLIFMISVAQWAGTGFGDLTNPIVPKIVILGLGIVVIGLQVIVAAFLVGILAIPFINSGTSPSST